MAMIRYNVQLRVTLFFFQPVSSKTFVQKKNKIYLMDKKKKEMGQFQNRFQLMGMSSAKKKRIIILSRSIWSDLHNQTRRACIPFTGNWWRFKTKKKIQKKKKEIFSFCPFGLHPNDEIEQHCVCWGCDLVGYWHKCQIQMIIKWVRRTARDHSMT